MPTTTVTDRQINFFQQALGSTSTSLNYLEYTFYSTNSGLSPVAKYSLSDHKRAFFVKELGLSGAANKSLSELERAWWDSYGTNPLYIGYSGKRFDFFGTQQYDPIPLLSGLQAYYRADKIAGQTLVSDTFDRSKNLLSGNDPSFEAGVSGISTGRTTVASDVSTAYSGTKSLQATVTAVDTTNYIFGSAYTPVIGGQQYTASGFFKGSKSNQAFLVIIYWYTSAQTYIIDTQGPQIIPTTGVWTKASVTGTAPANAAYARVLYNNTAAGAVIGDTWNLDARQLELGSKDTAFTWGDSSNLGVADTGQAWVTLLNGFGVVNGKARSLGGAGGARSYIETGCSDVEVSVQNQGAGGFLILRVADANNLFLINGSQYTKIIGGVTTALFSFPAPAANATIKAVVSGSTHTLYVDNVQVGTVTDTFNMDATKHGIRVSSVGLDLDNFSIKVCPCPDGMPVSCWPDLSGNNRHAVQNTYTPPNLLTQNQATIETDTTGWTVNGGGSVTKSSAQSAEGVASLLMTFPALTATGISSARTVATTGLTVGLSYTIMASVYVPTGSTAVTIGVPSVSDGPNTGATKDAWVVLSHTFVATATSHNMQFKNTAMIGATDEICYIDKIGLFQSSTVPTWRAPNDPSGFLSRPLLRTASPNLLSYNSATIETDATGWVNSSGISSITRVTTQAAHGSASLGLAATGGVTMRARILAADRITVTAGETMSAHMSVKASVTNRSCNVRIYWYKTDGSAASTTFNSGTATGTTDGWTNVSVTAAAPADATLADISLVVNDATLGAGEVFYFDKMGIYRGTVTTWVPPVAIPNSKAAVQFDGLDDKLITATNLPELATESMTIFFVAKNNKGGDASYAALMGVYDNGASSSKYTWDVGAIRNGNLRITARDGLNTSLDTASMATNPSFANSPIVVSSVVNAIGAGSTQNVYVNGVISHTVTQTRSTGFGGVVFPFVIGARNPIDSITSSVEIESIAVFNRVLTATERIKVGKFLASRFAVTYASVQDSFNRADSTTSLGVADSGQTWQTVLSTMGISSNKAGSVSGTSSAVINANKTDVDISCDIVHNGNSSGVVFRFIDANNRLQSYISSVGTLTLIQVDDGVTTTLGTNALALSSTTSYRLRTTIVGSVITVYVDGVQQLTYTLTGTAATKFASATTVGIRIAGTTGTIDNFSVI